MPTQLHISPHYFEYFFTIFFPNLITTVVLAKLCKNPPPTVKDSEQNFYYSHTFFSLSLSWLDLTSHNSDIFLLPNTHYFSVYHLPTCTPSGSTQLEMCNLHLKLWSANSLKNVYFHHLQIGICIVQNIFRTQLGKKQKKSKTFSCLTTDDLIFYP